MSKKDDNILYWLQSAASDMSVAEHLFEKEDYHYCLFFGHLVLEKTLKAEERGPPAINVEEGSDI